MQSRTVREFDSKFTIPMFGFTSTEEYFAVASPDNKIDRVRVPVLCLNAADDPLVPYESELMALNLRDLETKGVYLSENKREDVQL